jgi:hypothetical protein
MHAMRAYPLIISYMNVEAVGLYLYAEFVFINIHAINIWPAHLSKRNGLQ